MAEQSPYSLPQPRGGAGSCCPAPGPWASPSTPLLPSPGASSPASTPPGEPLRPIRGDAWNAGTARRAQEARLQRLVAGGRRSLAAGLGRPLSQVAFNWVAAAQPGVTSPIIGPRTLEQLQDNAGALEWDLDEGTVAQLTRPPTPT